MRISIGPGGQWQPYARGIAVPVHRWFLSRPDDLDIISLLLLQHCVFEVDLFPDFGWSGFARDISRNYVVVGCGRGVFIKRSNSTSQGDDLDYGRGRETYNHQEVSTKGEDLWCGPDLL